MLRKKAIRTILLVMSFVILGSTTVLAASYKFHFVPPFAGCIQHSDPSTANGKLTPYVQVKGSSAETTYVLTMPGKSSIDEVTGFLTNIESGRYTFKYKSGFGGKGQKYKLTGFPTRMDFNRYDVGGTWQP